MTDPILIPAWVDGVLTPVDKLETHRRGLRHKAVSVFVARDDGILLQRRALTKYHTPGLWANACCTHPLWGEPDLTCAARRMDQELGVRGLTYVARGGVEYRADVGGGLTEHEVVKIFHADAPPDLVLDPNPDEVMATRWIAIDALMGEIADRPEAFTPWLRIYMAKHRRMIFGAPAAG